MFLKMVHPHFVYNFTIIIVLNLNPLSLKVKKIYMCQLTRVAITGRIQLKKNNNSSYKIPCYSFFTFSLMMGSLAHHNISQFLTFRNKTALRQNKIILLCDLRLIINGMFAATLVKAIMFYTVTANFTKDAYWLQTKKWIPFFLKGFFNFVFGN